MRLRHPLAIAILLAAWLAAVSGSAAEPEAIEFFEKRVRPILVEHCYQCHGPDDQQSDLRLDRLAALDPSRSIVAPGKPNSSLLITAVRYVDENLQMPPDGKLPAAAIADLEKWVELGAPHPDAMPAPMAAAEDGARDGADHWAFQPIERRQPPAVEGDWGATPIDRFLLARLQSEGLAPAGPADKRTLIRRATFDLHGLPPTPAEVEAFLADDSPQAFARLVERLLASPRYGERWGRHWLNVARYADSNGLDENVAHGNAWRYRDWVIDAFNDDKPYDRFVVEQLAGDLLPAGGPEEANRNRIATGFLSLGAKVLAEVDKQKMEMDIIDEQIDTVGRAFMGLTLGCARCHDHKFDPVTAADYYALAGIFKSTHTMDSFKTIAVWHEHPLHSDLHEQQLAAHAERVAGRRQVLADAVAAATEALQQQLGEAAALPAEPEESFPEETRAELKQLREEIAALEKAAPQPPTAMGVREGTPSDVPIHIRGSHLTLGETQPRGFIEVLSGERSPAVASDSSGRLELGQWLTEPGHPLTARVMVNRIWRWHFGRGLASTTDNFGLQGSPPSHGELLDYLAAEFIDSGWSIKHMHRLIMLSAVYRLSSEALPRRSAADPANRLLARASARRLEAEEVRDAMLAVAGMLDETRGGSLLSAENRKHIFDHTSRDATTYEARRRSVYLPVVRNHLHDAFTLFDYTDASVSTSDRTTSTVASQALYLMNSEFMAGVSAGLADRLLSLDPAADEARRIGLLYELAYGRPAAAGEIERLSAARGRFEQQLAASAEPSVAENSARESWRLVCQAVLMSNEFFYLR